MHPSLQVTNDALLLQASPGSHLESGRQDDQIDKSIALYLTTNAPYTEDKPIMPIIFYPRDSPDVT